MRWCVTRTLRESGFLIGRRLHVLLAPPTEPYFRSGRKCPLCADCMSCSETAAISQAPRFDWDLCSKRRSYLSCQGSCSMSNR